MTGAFILSIKSDGEIEMCPQISLVCIIHIGVSWLGFAASWTSSRPCGVTLRDGASEFPSAQADVTRRLERGDPAR